MRTQLTSICNGEKNSILKYLGLGRSQLPQETTTDYINFKIWYTNYMLNRNISESHKNTMMSR